MIRTKTATSSSFRTIPYLLLSLGILAASFAVFLNLVPAKLITDDAVLILTAVAVFTLLLYTGLVVCQSRNLDVRATLLRSGCLIWFCLLVAEGVFDRMGDEIDTYRGLFSVEAYGEAVVWAVSAAALLIVLLPLNRICTVSG